MKCTNLSRNPGDELIKAIYAAAYRLEATEIVINSVRYGRYADVTLYECDDCIELHYIVAI